MVANGEGNSHGRVKTSEFYAALLKQNERMDESERRTLVRIEEVERRVLARVDKISDKLDLMLTEGTPIIRKLERKLDLEIECLQAGIDKANGRIDTSNEQITDLRIKSNRLDAIIGIGAAIGASIAAVLGRQ
jgi:hypothetical protein